MNVAIIYFSGTGNTQIIAEMLFESLERISSCNLFEMERLLKKDKAFDVRGYDAIGIGYPIYGFNAPAIAFDFVRDLPDNAHKNVFLFSTCAGPIYFNDVASFSIKKKLVRKGYSVFYERQFYMPPNVAIQYRDSIVKQLFDAARRKTGIMAIELVNHRKRLRNDTFWPYFLCWLRFLEKLSWQTVPMDFYVKNSCTLCGICVQQCPRSNIKLRKNKIRFGLRCLACYRCVYRCPQNAISGRLYGFAILKDGYDIQSILNSKDIRGDGINENTKGYYRIFLPYMEKDD